MFKKKPATPDPLEEEMTRVLDELSGLSSVTKEYKASLARYKELHAIKASLKKKPKISADAWLGLGAHLGGLGMILGFEKANVLTSKAISFVHKPTLKTGPTTK